MKHLRFTYVDAVTGISIASEPAANGPAFPAVAGMEFAWARESKYPTDVPEFFGTCPDDSSTQIDGVLSTLSREDYAAMHADEMRARNPVPLEVARAQGKAALIQAGMWPAVLGFVAAIPGETDRLLAEVALHDTQAWRRDSPFLGAAKTALGMTDEQLDALFLAAHQINL